MLLGHVVQKIPSTARFFRFYSDSNFFFAPLINFFKTMNNKEKIKKKKQFYFEEEPKPKRREKEHKSKYRNHKAWLDNEENDKYTHDE